MRQHVWADHVAAPDFDPVHADFLGGPVDQALEKEFRFRPARAAIGAGRNGVGEHSFHVVGDRRCLVDADDVAADDHRRGPRAHRGQVRAEIADAVDAEREEICVLVERHRELERHRPTMVIGQEAFGPVGGPFNRAAQLSGGMQGDDRFIERAALHTEGSADFFRDHPHLVRGGAHHVGHGAAESGNALGANMKGEFFGCRIVLRDRGAGFHRADDDLGVGQFDPGHMGSGDKRLFDRVVVAPLEIEADIVWGVVPDRRCAVFDRGDRIADRRKIRDVEHDQFHRVARLSRGFGDDNGDRVADMLDLSDGHGGPGRHNGGRSVAAFHADRAGNVLHVVGAQILAGMNGDDTGGGRGGGCIELDDIAMRDRRAQKDGIGLSRGAEVVGIFTATSQQFGVLRPENGLANTKFECVQNCAVGHIFGLSDGGGEGDFRLM